MIKNLIELSDTETYKGVPVKYALILLLSALFLSSYTKLSEVAEGLTTQPQIGKRKGSV